MRRILVADDDDAIRRLATVVLKRAHYAVDTAVNGRDALEKIAVTAYDVVVLDLMMPEVSGFDFLARAPDRMPVSQFVVVTSAASPEVIARADGANVFASLRKPYDIAELVSTVDACIAGGLPPLVEQTLLSASPQTGVSALQV